MCCWHLIYLQIFCYKIHGLCFDGHPNPLGLSIRSTRCIALFYYHKKLRVRIERLQPFVAYNIGSWLLFLSIKFSVIIIHNCNSLIYSLHYYLKTSHYWYIECKLPCVLAFYMIPPWYSTYHKVLAHGRLDCGRQYFLLAQSRHILCISKHSLHNEVCGCDN